MEIKLKKLHPEAVIPQYSKSGDAAMDLTAISEKIFFEHGAAVVEYGTGLSMEIPEGYVGLIFPRSSIVTKTTLALGNAVGVIDSGYRGEIKAQFRNVNYGSNTKYNVGDRIAQIMIIPHPKVQFTVVDELSSSDRNTGGFGSTGA